MLTPYRIIAALLAIIALVGSMLAYGHRQYTLGVTHTTDRYQAAINAQEAQAEALLATETAKTRIAEQALQTTKNQQERQDASHQKTIADLSGRLRVIAGATGRLRDPNATAGCGSGSGSAQGGIASTAGAGTDHGAQAGGLLSQSLTELLWDLARDADDINVAYASCRADAYAVRVGR